MVSFLFLSRSALSILLLTSWTPIVNGLTKNSQSLHEPRPLKPRSLETIDQGTFLTNTSAAPSVNVEELVKRQASPNPTGTKSTFLVIARDSSSAYSAYSGLEGYGIPYEILIVPAAGAPLPVLYSSGSPTGNFGGIVILSEVSYEDASGLYASALTTAQWSSLYSYQLMFGVRMVRLDVSPSNETGTVALGGCCGASQEQNITLSDVSAFSTAGLIQGATLSTIGLYHYPATISNSSVATPFAEFGTTTGFTTTSVAGVINNFSGRQQMAFFIGFSTEWSITSNLLQHAWITWATRSIYPGIRRILLNTQVDNMFLQSSIYQPVGIYRVTPADLTPHVGWMTSLNARLPSGSNYTIEVGHNGNGDIIEKVSKTAENQTDASRSPPLLITQPVRVDQLAYSELTAPPVEFVKPLGTGTDLWPETSGSYPYLLECMELDPLELFWENATNREAFSHVSNTFTHENEDNATYFDAVREIFWNQIFLDRTNIARATGFSPRGLIPPSITGLHNGDALRAWSDNYIQNVVGDNSRSSLLNPTNEHWPVITTVAANGFAGTRITPRAAVNIYFNCDTVSCNVNEWIAIAGGSGGLSDLLAVEKTTNIRSLLALQHDPFMFNQANLRQADVTPSTVNGVTEKYSLLQVWVETIAQELARLASWPIISLKLDDLAQSYVDRMTRDQCNYNVVNAIDSASQTITGFQVTTAGNTCNASIPVTVPGPVANTKGFFTEQIGSDPLTIWVPLTGSPVSFTLQKPIAW